MHGKVFIGVQKGSIRKVPGGRVESEICSKDVRYQREVAVKHGIPAFGTVCNWLEKYRKYGEDAFIRKNKKSIPVPDKSAISAPPLPTLTKDEREELEQLRVENAYLKKLKALVQQKTCSTFRKK